MADQIDLTGNQSPSENKLFSNDEYNEAVANLSKGRLGSNQATSTNTLNPKSYSYNIKQ
jgi:hypothetical protein